MKNYGFIKCMILLLGISIVSNQGLNAQEFKPEFDAQALTSEIAIDGNKADWDAIEELPMNPVSGQDFLNGEEDCNVSYKVTWDAEKLYLLVDITDPEAVILDDENITVANDPWAVDNIEFFVDLDNSDSETKDGINDFQIRMPRQVSVIPGAEGWPNGLGDFPTMVNSPGATSDFDHQKGWVEGFGFEITKTETETGWILEAAFPWDVLSKVDENLSAADMVDGKEIGIMVQYADRDAFDENDRTKFFNVEDGNHNKPFGWGTMTLKGEPVSGPVFKPDFDAQALTSEIAIDGNKADWDAIEELPMNPVSGQDFLNGEEDCNVSYKVTWDAEKLYLLVDITDPEAVILDDENITVANDPWAVDNIEFFVDLDNSDGSSLDDKNDFQIRMLRQIEIVPGETGWPNSLGTFPSLVNSPGATSQFDHMNGWVKGFGFEIIKTETGTGWILEAAFPWDTIAKVDENLSAADMVDGKEIGIMVQYQDRDAPDENDRTKFLSVEGGKWNDPSGWGTMTLKGGGQTPTEGLITIDGEIDEKWVDVRQFDIATVVDPENLAPHDVTDENDLSGYFKVLWDEDNLYVLGVVKDDILIKTDNGNETDHLNIYLDPENSKVAAPEDEPGLISVGAAYDTEEIKGRIAPGWGNPPGYDFKLKTTEDGYVVEFKIESDSIRLNKLEAGMMIGLDVKINDVDDTTEVNRDQLAWIDKDDLIYRDVWRYGTIELLDGGQVKGYTKPGMPANFSYTTDGNSITFSWDEAQGALGYYIFQNGELIKEVTENSATIGELNFLKLYSFELQAYGEGDVRSYFTEPLDILLPVPELDAPEITSETEGNTITLSWQSVEYADGYKIYKDGEEVADITDTKYLVNDLADGTHNYSVKAYAGDVVSGESNIVPVVFSGIDGIKGISVTIGPNPAEHFISVNCSQNIHEIGIYDVYGQKVSHISNVNNKQKINVSQLRTGIYIISLKTDYGLYKQKIIRK
jgi:hypothetical protein